MQENNDLPAQTTDLENKKPKTKKPLSKKAKIVLTSVGALAIAVGTFFLGYGAYQWQMDDEMLSLIRLKDAIQRHYYEEISDDEFYKVLYDAVENGLLDKYSEYLTADEWADERKEAEGSYHGVGLSLGQTEEGLYVGGVSGNSSAEEAGIVPRSTVLAYGATTETTEDATTVDAFRAFLQSLPEGAPAYLKIKTPSGQTHTAEVYRRAYVENYVYYRSKTGGYSFTGEDALTETPKANLALSVLDDDTAYIRLTQFNGSASVQFAMAMNRFRAEGKKHLVLDLRENGGGYLNILTEIASYFCKGASGKPTVATAKYRDGRVKTFQASASRYDDYFASDSQVYVLADRGTASASECLLGCLYDYGASSYQNTCLIERDGVAKTYGKGIMQSTFYLTLSARPEVVTLTVATVHWPKTDECIHGVGVTTEDGALSSPATADDETELLLALEKLGF